MRAAVHKGEIMAQIELSHVSKEYLVAKKEKGLRGVVKNLFFAEKRKISAVRDISFSIERGEIVGYIGPNGAGKSTTLKMMCGIMMPTGGEIRVNGISPAGEEKGGAESGRGFWAADPVILGSAAWGNLRAAQADLPGA